MLEIDCLCDQRATPAKNVYIAGQTRGGASGANRGPLWRRGLNPRRVPLISRISAMGFVDCRRALERGFIIVYWVPQ